MKKIAALFIVLIGLVIFLNINHKSPEQLISITGQTMGTTYHIKVLADQSTNIDIDTLKKEIDQRLFQIDHKMSTYKQDSELSLFNQFPANQWMNISPELMYVINCGQQLSTATEGAFDITLGKLVNLWGFGPTINTSTIPSADTIHKLQQYIGYNRLKLQPSPPALLKENDSIYVDLSAIAKGYAVDAIALVIEHNNIENFLVEIGGEIITSGHKNDNLPWVVGIETPVTNARKVEKQLRLNGVAMATSGDYRNYFEQDGVRYSHTIDPQTGYPIKHKLASVTVIAQNCMQADGLATSFMVMGPIKALEYAQSNNIAVFMLIKNGINFSEVSSDSFNKYLHSHP
ncbi:MAG: FAD:protein FMN transferase [Desulfuromonas sp.]|nr:FAD:protein FMN transferase [Desulfuromonas sp.]